MNLKDAAERVLKKVGRPMHSTDIIDFAIKRGWIAPRGKTPDHSLQAAIWAETHDDRNQSRFRIVVEGEGPVHRKYWLRKRPKA
jgi:hypothetical protein